MRIHEDFRYEISIVKSYLSIHFNKKIAACWEPLPSENHCPLKLWSEHVHWKIPAHQNSLLSGIQWIGVEWAVIFSGPWFPTGNDYWYHSINTNWKVTSTHWKIIVCWNSLPSEIQWIGVYRMIPMVIACKKSFPTEIHYVLKSIAPWHLYFLWLKTKKVSMIISFLFVTRNKCVLTLFPFQLLALMNVVWA